MLIRLPHGTEAVEKLNVRTVFWGKSEEEKEANLRVKMAAEMDRRCDNLRAHLTLFVTIYVGIVLWGINILTDSTQ